MSDRQLKSRPPEVRCLRDDVQVLSIGRVIPGTEDRPHLLIPISWRDDDPIEVSDYYMNKHRPEAGGYWIRYEGSLESYCSAEDFEKNFVEVRGFELTKETP